ncbi:MAG: flavin reductase family protein [Parvularculaceae bacterium]
MTSDPYRPLKDAFARFATGVAIVACANDRGGFTAITVNSFTSVSLEPPLVLWCLEKTASSFADFSAADSYTISVLKSDQRKISERFAMHGAYPLRLDETEVLETGAPLLIERLAGLDCRIADRIEAGDHVIIIGEVVAFDSGDGAPLLYFASDYAKGPYKE